MLSLEEFICATRDSQLKSIYEALGGGSGSGFVGLTDTQLRASPVSVTVESFRATATFTRPGDTNVYAQFDAITNSTSAPTIMTLAITGAASGDFIEVRSARVTTSTKPSGTRLLANAFIAPASFTGTNDNAELSLDDTTMASGIWIPCNNQYQSALNFRCSSDPGSWILQLSGGNVFAALQANNAWNPGNADSITLAIEGFVYKQ